MDEAIEAINLTDDEAIAVKEDRYRFFFFCAGDLDVFVDNAYLSKYNQCKSVVYQIWDNIARK